MTATSHLGGLQAPQIRHFLNRPITSIAAPISPSYSIFSALACVGGTTVSLVVPAGSRPCLPLVAFGIQGGGSWFFAVLLSRV